MKKQVSYPNKASTTGGMSSKSMSHTSRNNTGKSLERATPHREVTLPASKMQGTASSTGANMYKGGSAQEDG